jgi:hypothetical protein
LAAGLLAILQSAGETPITPVEAINSIGKPTALVEMSVKQAKDRPYLPMHGSAQISVIALN